MKEDLVLIEAFSFIWIKVISDTTVKWDHLILVLKIYQHGNQLVVCFYHVTYAFQSESTLYSCLNVKELLARSRREI